MTAGASAGRTIVKISLGTFRPNAKCARPIQLAIERMIYPRFTQSLPLPSARNPAKLGRAVLTLVSIAGLVGCGSSDSERNVPATMTTPLTALAATPSGTDTPPELSNTDVPATTITVGTPARTTYTTDTITGAEPVSVDRRALLERRAAMFELLDPRLDPARYVAMSSRFCRQQADEHTVREDGTAGVLGDDARRLALLDRGTRVVGTEVFGYRPDKAQVAVTLDGDPADGSGRIRQWTLEDGDWRVESCSG